MLKSFAGSDVATQFHQAYYLQLLREVLAVMTDTFHTPGFKLHCRVLLHLFGIVRGETVIKAPLWDVAVGCAGPFAQSPWLHSCGSPVLPPPAATEVVLLLTACGG